MKKITQEFKKVTQPLTIEMSGRDAELLLSLLGGLSHSIINDLLDASAIADTFKARLDQVDGMTDELFELLDNHVNGE